MKANSKISDDRFSEAINEIESLKTERDILKRELEGRKSEIVHLKEDIGGISEIMDLPQRSSRFRRNTSNRNENIISEVSVEEEHSLPEHLLMNSDLTINSVEKGVHEPGSLMSELNLYTDKKAAFEKSATMPLKKEDGRMSTSRRDNLFNELLALKKLDYVDDGALQAFSTNRKITENREDFTYFKTFQPSGHYDLDDCAKTSDSNNNQVKMRKPCFNSIDRDIYEDFFTLVISTFNNLRPLNV